MNGGGLDLPTHSPHNIDNKKIKLFMSKQLILLIFLILASGFFSAAEIALTALSRAKIRSMENDQRFGSQPILKLKAHPQRTLVSILISNQVVNVLATVVVTLWGVALFGEREIGWVTLLFTVTLMLVGSIGPKTLALRFAEPFARIMAYPLYFFLLLIRPVFWILKGIGTAFARLLNLKMKELPTSSNEEIRAMLEIAQEEGVLSEEEENFMIQILKFSKTEVKDIMTMLKDINAISMEIERKELVDFFEQHSHTYFPVYEEDLNKIRGIISVHDLVQIIQHSKLKHPLHDHRFSVAVVVPKTASLVELFKIFKDNKKHMAMVFDEYGQTIGLVTLNDILEEITGLKSKGGNEAKLTALRANQWEAEGEVTVAKLNEALGMLLPFHEHQTLAFVILENLKRFPETAEILDFEGFSFTVQRLEKNVIKKVLVKKRAENKKG